MALFQKKIGPVFLKEKSITLEQIERLCELSQNATGELKEEIEKQIKMLQYGEYGEQTIAFELKNSGIDMYILHDVYIEQGDLSAQIDYLIVSRKCIYILECKNLIGNIEVDSNGNFIRTYEINGKRLKEGIYSPITQNQRHLRVIKEKGLERRTNILSKALFEKNFNNYYKSLVVLSNPKTYLNAKYAKKEIKNQIVRADQLAAKIKEIEKTSQEMEMSVDQMRDIAESFLKHHRENPTDYLRKLEEQVKESIAETVSQATEEVNAKVDLEKLINELKKFRLETSRAEGLKPYYIFTDAQMEDLITKYPKSCEELLAVNGFGKTKVDKYGKKIVQIMIGAQG